jgi:hypothetical protein
VTGGQGRLAGSVLPKQVRVRLLEVADHLVYPVVCLLIDICLELRFQVEIVIPGLDSMLR